MKHLEERMQYHTDWNTKLTVSSAFLAQKVDHLIKSFNRLADVTGVTNPSDLETLTGILDKTS